MKKDIDAFMNHYGVQGAVVGMMDIEGNWTLRHVYQNSGTYPVDENTRFGIASISKFFTALAILICHGKGWLNIDDKIQKFFPDFNDDSVKIRHFLSHASGFFPQDRLLLNELALELDIDISLTEMAYDTSFSFVAAERIIHQLNADSRRIDGAGQVFSYFNDGFGLLSYIVEVVGPDASFGEFMKNMIFIPLGMDRTTIEFLSVNDDKLTSNQYEFVGGQITSFKDYHRSAFVLHGGGAMKSNLDDLGIVLRSILQENLALLESSLFKQMYQPVVESSLNSFYGMGLDCHTVDGKHIIGHAGSLPGVSSAMFGDISSGRGCIILCNTGGVPVSELAFKLLGVEHIPEEIILWDENLLSLITGKYLALEGYDIEILKNKELIYQGEVYQFKTHNHHYISFLEGDTPKYFKFIMVCGHVIGIRVGARILSRL